MATYAIGDIQGCFHAFQDLIQSIRFNPAQDRLWLVGDIINRGSGSLEMLRWAFAHRESLVMVLGNHDLHTLAVAEGFVPQHKSDTLQALLAAPDANDLFDWLRRQPLIYVAEGYLMVHAGLLPQWTAEQALSLGEEVHQVLAGASYRDFLACMYGNQPDQWQDDLQGMDRLRLITNAMTRLRVCTPEGKMDFKFTGEVQHMPQGLQPWFDLQNRQSKDANIVFGHWSALGLMMRPNLHALDTGCLWGGQLTAMRLEDQAVFQVPCHQADAPRKPNQ